MARLLEGTPFDRPPRCERCGLLESECSCPPTPARATVPPGQQTARVSLEKRPGHRSATVVAGLSEEEKDLQRLLAELRARCGAGGTVKNGRIEIQGEHLERVRHFLSELGYRVKK